MQTTSSKLNSPCAQAFFELLRVSASQLPADVQRAIEAAAAAEEPGTNAHHALQVINQNIALAASGGRALCQDSGSILCYVRAPSTYALDACTQDLHAAVRAATAAGYLRQNAVDPLSGKNTGDNIGPGSPSIYYQPWDEDSIQVQLILKGGGCENVGAQYALPDPQLGGRDLQGVERAILQAVLDAQGQGCGPGVLGVCIGGDRGSGYAESKRQFLRCLDDENPHPQLAELEQRVVEQANHLGIGPMGFGGRSTLLRCKIGTLCRLPASFFVSVSYMCWAMRRQGIRLSLQGEIEEWLY